LGAYTKPPLLTIVSGGRMAWKLSTTDAHPSRM